jgi:hypothetical protein
MKTKQEIVKEWINKNGACSIDLKNKEFTLYDGGLFEIQEKKVKRRKILGFKKLPNGGSEVLFSKNKCVNDIEHYMIVWFQELEDTINYFVRLKKLLNLLGYNTSLKKEVITTWLKKDLLIL